MGYFELLCQGCTGLVTPGGSVTEIAVVPATNPNYTALGPYFTPSDTLGDGTAFKPFATVARALAEAGRIIDKAVVVRLHNAGYAPLTPALRSTKTARTVENGEWDINPVGGKGKLFIVADLCVGNDDTTAARGEGGTAVGAGTILDKSVFVEGAMRLDVLDGAPGWNVAYTPVQDLEIAYSWLEWTEGAGATKYRAKILGIDNTTAPGTTRFYLQLPKSGTLPTLVVDAASIAVVKPGYRLMNVAAGTLQHTTVHMMGTRTGRNFFGQFYANIGDWYAYPNIILHGLSIWNNSADPVGVAVTGGNYGHGMLELRANNHVVVDSILSIQSLIPLLGGTNQDDAIICGDVMFMVLLAAAGGIQISQANGLMNIAILPKAAGSNPVVYGMGCALEIANQNIVVAPGIATTLLRTEVNDEAVLYATGSFNCGRKLKFEGGGRLKFRGWTNGGRHTAITLSGRSSTGSGRLHIVEGDLEIESGMMHLDESAVLGLDLVPGAGIGESAVIWIEPKGSMKIGNGGELDATNLGVRAPYIGANVINKPFLVAKGEFLNEGVVRCSGSGAPLAGDSFDAMAAIQVLRGTRVLSHNGTKNGVFEIQNENIFAADILAIIERSVAGFDNSLGTTLLNIVGAVTGNVLFMTKGSVAIPAPLAPAVNINDLPAAPTGAEDTSVLVMF